MSLFNHKKSQENELSSGSYDFAKLVKNARETNPDKFKKLQGAFKKLVTPAPKHPDK